MFPDCSGRPSLHSNILSHGLTVTVDLPGGPVLLEKQALDLMEHQEQHASDEEYPPFPVVVLLSSHVHLFLQEASQVHASFGRWSKRFHASPNVDAVILRICRIHR